MTTAEKKENTYNAKTVPEGMYQGSPVGCAVVELERADKSGTYRQFVIEMMVKVPILYSDGTTEIEDVLMPKKGGIDLDQGYEFALQDAERCGCKTVNDDGTDISIFDFKVDPKKVLSCKVVKNAQYGSELKSIFDNGNQAPGAFISQGAVAADKQAAMREEFALRRQAMRASAGQTVAQPSQQQLDVGAQQAQAKKRRSPL